MQSLALDRTKPEGHAARAVVRWMQMLVFGLGGPCLAAVALTPACALEVPGLAKSEPRDSRSQGPSRVASGGVRGTSSGGGVIDCATELGQTFVPDASLDIFGKTVYFAGGAEFPRGLYEVRYLQGCVKYYRTYGWNVNLEPDVAWWLVEGNPSERLLQAPGITGQPLSNAEFVDFDECVAANLRLPPVQFDFSGGSLGIMLVDSIYGDNIGGLDGENPAWSLTLLDCDDTR